VLLAMTVLRDDLLTGRTIVLAGSASEELGELVGRLGATVVRERRADSDSVAAGAAGVAEPVDALVHDASAVFAEGGLQAALQDTWDAVAAIAGELMIPAERAGKVVLIAPAAGAGSHAEAARAGIENLVRTLSVEWARYAITTAAITPGARTSPATVAELVAFVLSPAGDYFSGCRFDLGAVEPT
jgi:NAD(P)-dependent dehydrogenase (short-subunit alcohol dehydrogenase family)